jgi:hypothetical protein
VGRRLKEEAESPSYRLKEPLNPSVRGTGKQSRREKKGFRLSSEGRREDAGNPGGHGRGGKTSRS